MRHEFSSEFVIGANLGRQTVKQAVDRNQPVISGRSCAPLVEKLALPDSARVITPVSRRVEDLERLADLAEIRDAQAVVAIGSGSVMDAAKYVACRRDLDLTVVPATLSCNAFATGTSVVDLDGRHTTLRTRAPRVVVIDEEVLDEAEHRSHLLGLADVLSCVTALHDWRLAHRHGFEKVDEISAGCARALADHLVDTASDLVVGLGTEFYTEIARQLMMSGLLTGFHGSGRPESGSEHKIARAIEEMDLPLGRIWHGEAVLIGMLIALELQRQECETAWLLAEAIHLGRRMAELDLGVEILVDRVIAARRTGSDRYTVLEAQSIDRTAARRAVRAVTDRFDDV